MLPGAHSTQGLGFTPGPFFVHLPRRTMSLVSGYDVLYRKTKSVIKTELFKETVDIEEQNTLRNLSDKQ